jgi:hypothetical protein
MVQSRLERAAHLFGSAAALRKASQGMLPVLDRIIYERNLARLQEQLEPAVLARAMEQGEALSPAQAIAYGKNPLITLSL